MNQSLNKKVLLGIFLAGLTACSHGPTVQDFPDTANAAEEVTKLDADMSAALKAQVDVLAPHNYKEANEALVDAKKSLDKQKDAKTTLHQVAEGRSYLNRATEFAQLSHANIEDVIVARGQAITAGAQGAFSKDFRSTDESLLDVTSDIENNKLTAAAESRNKLQAEYLSLELRAIKLGALGGAQQTIDLAMKEGAKEFAPRSLAVAEKTMKDADAFIIANRHDTAQVKARSDKSLASADHLLKITRDSKAGKKTSSEDTALMMESGQLRLADKQGQLEQSQTEVGQKQSQIDSKQNQLTQERGANQALSAENQDLSAKQAFDRRFEEARAEFTSSEAEVYRQGNVLTIRLRTLEFPKSQSVLKESNFPLLAKVQKVIKGFGKSSSVIVEGHTDSVGGKGLNEKLSTQRAEAVKSYLESNSEADQFKVQAIGYGYQKPLATNKTSSGRAQNRRVDVLIQSEMSDSI